MSLEIACTCGWRCQASEYYLGDRVACPECGAKIAVSARSGIPYGYAPYPTWQKRRLMPAPLSRRITMLPAEDPHASPALWLGLFSMLCAMTGCGLVFGLIIAAFGIRQSVRSIGWNRRRARPLQVKALTGLAMSSLAILLTGVLFLSLFANTGRTHRPCSMPRSQSVRPDDRPSQQFQYQPSTDAWKREHDERMKRFMADRQAWEQSAKEQGYRYPAPPAPQAPPFVRTQDFERDQSEYSRRVQEQRAKPEFRYGK